MKSIKCPSCDGLKRLHIDRAPGGAVDCFVCDGTGEIPSELAEAMAAMFGEPKKTETKPAQPVRFDESDWK